MFFFFCRFREKVSNFILIKKKEQIFVNVFFFHISPDFSAAINIIKAEFEEIYIEVKWSKEVEPWQRYA